MNMPYCRFQNATSQLQDCLDNLRSLDPEDQGPNTESEKCARRDLITTAALLFDELGIYNVSNTYRLEQAMDRLDEGEGFEAGEEEY